jgi:hypothetical protein
VLNNDVKGTDDSLVGAYKLAKSTPAALIHFYSLYNIIFYYKGATGTNSDTQSATVTLFFVYYRQIPHTAVSITTTFYLLK